MDVVVQDASTLLNLLKSGLLQCAVETLELHILTTDLVAAEIKSPKAAFDAAVSRGWIEVRSFSALELIGLATERQNAKGLTIQDVSVVALARTVGCPLFSSDGPVRNYDDGKQGTTANERSSRTYCQMVGGLSLIQFSGEERAR